jgi:hypothetical protein
MPCGSLRSGKNFPPRSLDREPPRPCTALHRPAGEPAAHIPGATQGTRRASGSAQHEQVSDHSGNDPPEQDDGWPADPVGGGAGAAGRGSASEDRRHASDSHRRHRRPRQLDRVVCDASGRRKVPPVLVAELRDDPAAVPGRYPGRRVPDLAVPGRQVRRGEPGIKIWAQIISLPSTTTRRTRRGPRTATPDIAMTRRARRAGRVTRGRVGGGMGGRSNMSGTRYPEIPAGRLVGSQSGSVRRRCATTGG